MDEQKTSDRGTDPIKESTTEAGEERFFPKKKGFTLDHFREAKLFMTPNRATLTFYLGPEVASMHFDQKRQEIFYKGHNVKNMTLTQEQWLALRKFAEYLEQHQADPELIQAYQECLAHVLPGR